MAELCIAGMAEMWGKFPIPYGASSLRDYTATSGCCVFYSVNTTKGAFYLIILLEGYLQKLNFNASSLCLISTSS